MSKEVLTDIDQAARRAIVADWIKGSVQPVAAVLAQPHEVDIDEEIVQEATEFEVREYQLDAWASLWDARQSGKKRGLIHLATGLGKTSVGVFDVLKFRQERSETGAPPPRILFTCHKNEILEQAAERFTAFIPDASQGFYNGETKHRDADITFATLQSLHDNLSSFKRNEYDYIIYDEAHHSQADTFSKVVNHFRPKFQLALTATPNRMDRQDIRELFGNERYSKGLAEALAEGWLARPDYHIVFDDAVKQAMESGFEATSLKALAELFNVAPRNDVITRNIKDEMARVGLEFGEAKTIVFCQNIQHAEEMASLLGGKAYHSEIPRNDRRQMLQDFRSGKLKTICTRDMFNEGVDVPDARLLVFLRSTSSQTVFEQQLGRGLRKSAGKDTVSVLDFVANVERIAMIQELAKEIRKNQPSINGSLDDIDGTNGGNPNVSGATFGISSNDAKFDFDRLAIDLLEKFSSLKRVGLNHDMLNLSKDELVALALSIKPDAPLTYVEIDELSKSRVFPSTPTIKTRFGSVSKFYEACGFEIKEDTAPEQLITEALTISPDAPLSQDQLRELSKKGSVLNYSIVARHFGSLTAFQQACGFEVYYFKEMSNEELVELALSINAERPLTTGEIDQLSKDGKFISYPTIKQRFGSINKFREICGFEVKEQPTKRVNSRASTDQDIIDLALSLSPERALKVDEINNLSKLGQFVSPTAIQKRFGSIPAFQKACGFEVKEVFDIKNTSDEELVEIAKKLSPDAPLKLRDIAAYSKQGQFASTTYIQKHFGSLGAFHKACGF